MTSLSTERRVNDDDIYRNNKPSFFSAYYFNRLMVFQRWFFSPIFICMTGGRRVMMVKAHLPAKLVLQPVFPVKAAVHKLTIDTNRPAVSLNDIFPGGFQSHLLYARWVVSGMSRLFVHQVGCFSHTCLLLVSVKRFQISQRIPRDMIRLVNFVAKKFFVCDKRE